MGSFYPHPVRQNCSLRKFLWFYIIFVYKLLQKPKTEILLFPICIPTLINRVRYINSLIHVPDYSRMFQIIQKISKSFSNVPDYSKMFQIILKCSSFFWISLIFLEYPRSFKNVPDYSRTFQIILKGSGLFLNIPDYSRISQIILECPRSF